MLPDNNTKEWWVKTLLGEESSAHPVFGESIHASVDGGVVILTGEVQTPDEAEQLEREARSIPAVRGIVNHLRVRGARDHYHLQTVIGVFPDLESAQIARKTAVIWKFRNEKPPDVVSDPKRGRECLLKRANAAEVPEDRIERYIHMLEQGKVLLVDRVPEDDALRVISALEGTPAESIQTLPPEPRTLVRS